MILTNLILHNVRELSGKFDLFWPSGLNDNTQFLHFRDYHPFEMDLALYLNKLEIPFTQRWFALSLIEISSLVLEKIIKMFSIFSLFCYYLFLEKGVLLQ
jgi:hypothetical protein